MPAVVADDLTGGPASSLAIHWKFMVSRTVSSTVAARKRQESLFAGVAGLSGRRVRDGRSVHKEFASKFVGTNVRVPELEARPSDGGFDARKNLQP
jgi:hypothetical protein